MASLYKSGTMVNALYYKGTVVKECYYKNTLVYKKYCWKKYSVSYTWTESSFSVGGCMTKMPFNGYEHAYFDRWTSGSAWVTYDSSTGIYTLNVSGDVRKTTITYNNYVIALSSGGYTYLVGSGNITQGSRYYDRYQEFTCQEYNRVNNGGYFKLYHVGYGSDGPGDATITNSINTPSKNAYISDVYNLNSSAYPDNGIHTDGYWYVKQ